MNMLSGILTGSQHSLYSTPSTSVWCSDQEGWWGLTGPREALSTPLVKALSVRQPLLCICLPQSSALSHTRCPECGIFCKTSPDEGHRRAPFFLCHFGTLRARTQPTEK